MSTGTIRFRTFPQTEPTPEFVNKVVAVFQNHLDKITTTQQRQLNSNEVLVELRNDLIKLEFEVESGKRKLQKIQRPVFFGENGVPTLRYEIDAYNTKWECGLEIEAGRAWMGNAVYRDLIQACVMVNLKHLILAVPNEYKFKSSGKSNHSNDYERSTNVAEALYGHSRLRLPYMLTLIGY